MGFSLYFRELRILGRAAGTHFSIVENTLLKASGTRFSEWLQDMRDRRDMSKYLRMRWSMN